MPTRLSDLQLILLTHAAGREDGQLLPFPPYASDSARTTRACKSLLRRSLVAEVPVTHAAKSWRTADDQRIGLVLTGTGLEAIGVDAGTDADAKELPSLAPAPPERRVSKRALVLDLLRRSEGATLAELVAATGWLPHSTRAALTGLRKQGHVLDRTQRDDTRCYRIAAQR